MYKLGITGGLGSGKSTASNFFQQNGAYIFDADFEAKTLLNNNSKLTQNIFSTFGQKVTSNNQLDLNRLSEIVFSTKSLQNKLNNLIWPEVFLLIKTTVQKIENEGKKLFIVDAALLLEAGYLSFFDSVLLVTANKSIRIQRALNRKNISIDQIKKRMSLQMPENEKKKLAHTTIVNNGSLQEFQDKLKKFEDCLIINQ